MSHEIDTTTGKAACFAVGEAPWHGLGTVIDEAATSAEAIKLAGLDWTVEQFPLFAKVPMTIDPGVREMLAVPNRVANVRTDTNGVLGVVSPTYRVFQNAEAFDFMDAIVGESLAMYNTAGSLRGGRRVWMLAKIPKEYRVGDDAVQPYVLLTNGHDGTQALRMIPTTVRVVCQNTLNLALEYGNGQGLAIPHWPKLDSRVREARKKLGIIGSRLDQFGEEMQALSDRKLTAIEAKDYFRDLFPPETQEQAKVKREMVLGNSGGLLDSIIDGQAEHQDVVQDLLAGHFARTEAEAKRNGQTLDTILGNFENERNAMPEIKHSAWAAYNAVSEWADHQRTVRGRTPADKADNRLNSVWFGKANQVKQEAYSSALALVN